MPDRHTTPGFWITVALVAVLVGYPLNFGPSMGLLYRDMVPNSVGLVAWYLYFPFGYLLRNGPEPVRDANDWYACLWLP